MSVWNVLPCYFWINQVGPCVENENQHELRWAQFWLWPLSKGPGTDKMYRCCRSCFMQCRQCPPIITRGQEQRTWQDPPALPLVCSSSESPRNQVNFGWRLILPNLSANLIVMVWLQILVNQTPFHQSTHQIQAKNETNSEGSWGFGIRAQIR